MFFWTLLRVDPVPKAYPYLVALWVTGAEVVGDAVLGLAVIADHSLIAGAYYHALGPALGTQPARPIRSSAAACSGSSVTSSACRSWPPP